MLLRRINTNVGVAFAALILLLAAVVGMSRVHAVGDSVDEIKYSFGNTSDSVVFDWHGTETTIYYGLDTSYGQSATGASSAITPVNTNGGQYIETPITGLQPSTTYHYKIGATGLDHTFQTIPSGDFNWVDVGDTMSTSCHADGAWMTAQQQLIANQNPTFVTHGGDIAVPNQCGLPSLHQYFVDQQVWSTGAAFQMVLGNHEYGSPLAGAPADAIKDSPSNYKGRAFVTNGQTVPNDGVSKTTQPGCGSETGSSVNTCRGEDWGWFKTGHVLFISYPEPWPGAQEEWQTKADALMASAQTDPNIDFIVTWGHRPPYTSSTEGPGLNIRDVTQALAAKYSPTASNPNGKYVLSIGHHAHSMEAFQKINGLSYVIDAAGGQGLTNWASTDPNSIWKLMHFGILSAHYSASAHTLSINMMCGASYQGDKKGTCTYGTPVFSESFTRPDITPPAPKPQLVVSHTDGVTTAQTGDMLSYTATVTNPTANATATGVELIADVPGNTSFVSADDGIVPAYNALVWELGDLAAGQTVTKHFTVQVGTVNPGNTVVSGARLNSTDASCQDPSSVCSVIDTDTVPNPNPLTQWVSNQSLETDQTGWTGIYNNSSTVTRVTGDGYDGTASLQITKNSGSGIAGVNAKPRLVLSTTNGLTYTGSVWVHAQSVGQVLQLQIREDTAAGAVVKTNNATWTATDTAWHQLVLPATAAGAGDQLTFSVMGTNMTLNSWFRADQLSLTSPN